MVHFCIQDIHLRCCEHITHLYSPKSAARNICKMKLKNKTKKLTSQLQNNLNYK